MFSSLNVYTLVMLGILDEGVVRILLLHKAPLSSTLLNFAQSFPNNIKPSKLLIKHYYTRPLKLT